MQRYLHFFVSDVLGHDNFKEIANFLIIVCVITVNRYDDNNAHPC